MTLYVVHVAIHWWDHGRERWQISTINTHARMPIGDAIERMAWWSESALDGEPCRCWLVPASDE